MRRPWHLFFEEVGFEPVEFTTAGTFFGPLKSAVFSPVSAIARMALGRLAVGDVSIYLVRKTTSPTTASAGRDSFYFRSTGA